MSFRAFSGRRGSLTKILVESCVDFEVAHLSVFMVWRLSYPEVPTLKLVVESRNGADNLYGVHINMCIATFLLVPSLYQWRRLLSPSLLWECGPSRSWWITERTLTKRRSQGEMVLLTLGYIIHLCCT